MVWRTLGTLERLNYLLKATKGIKKRHHVCAINVNVLVDEN